MSELIICALHADINMIPDTSQRIQRNVYHMHIRMIKSLDCLVPTLLYTNRQTLVFANYQVTI